MGACDSLNNTKNNKYRHRQTHHNQNNKSNDNYNDEDFYDERKNSYFPESYNDEGKLILNNDVLVTNSAKNPFHIYKALNLLGEGAFGEVWKVKHKLTGKEFAMKIIQKKPEFKEKSILNEINILKKLDHPNILKILEFYYSSDKFFIITEFCTGGELYKEIKKRNIFPEDQTAFVLYQIFSAIRYCHKMRIIHEDIKPENIMITKRDKNNYLYIKLIDFGTAKIFKEGNMQEGMIGSAYYIAPEVIDGKYNELCDIWSIGVIMYIMLIGSPPFDGDSDEEILRSIRKGVYRTSSRNYKNISDNAKDLMKKLLEYNPSKRITAKNALNHPWFQNSSFQKIINNNNLSLNEIQNMFKNLENYRNDNIIKSTAFAYLVHQNTDIIQCQNAIKLFSEIDLNFDGKLDPFELEQAFIKFYNINQAEARKKVKKIFEKIDTNNSGFIESEEFIRACINPRIFNSENLLKIAFDYFDENGDGYISIEQLQKKFLQSSKNKSSVAKRELKDLFQSIDEDKDGYISFQEFSWMMRNIINN